MNDWARRLLQLSETIKAIKNKKRIGWADILFKFTAKNVLLDEKMKK